MNTRSDFVRVRGLRFHIRIWGDDTRPALWLLPGLMDTSATWQPVAEILAQHWQVHSPDARGMGYTEWPQDGYWFPDYVGDLEGLLDHYSPNESVLLVGHSMGAQVASLYAGLRPQRVKKLACLDGLFLPDMEAQLAPKRLRHWLDAIKKPSKQRTYDSYDALARRIRMNHRQVDEEKSQFIARCWANTDGHGRVRLLADPKHNLPSPGLYQAAQSMAVWKQITAPVLFVDGGASEFRTAISPEEAAARRGCFAHRHEVMIEGAGHMLHFDRAAETAQAILDFMRR